MTHRWRCDECEEIFNETDLLTAPNPFNANETVAGCPACKSVNCFTNICDEPGCTRPASCGFPVPGGYRRTCYDHSHLEKEANA